MWLVPAASVLAKAAGRVYYRLTVAGASLPRRGPVLLVANHPNSLLDPILVVAAAGRPVRFLAKAPLFSDPKLGWMMRGAGAIPVFRQMDDPSKMSGNLDSLRAAQQELAHGWAVGIFPEGKSHDEPELASMKTGAARIALGAIAAGATPFPIIPIGLVPRRKEVFRSETMVLRGAPIPWDDLAARGTGDRGAVRELTARIDEGLRDVTVNLEQWDDRALVECAEQIWVAERDGADDPPSRLHRIRIAGDALRRLRETGDVSIVERVRTHARRLGRIGLRPIDLKTDARLALAVPWALRRIYLAGPPLLAVAIAGFILFWIPRQLTGITTRATHPLRDQVSTWQLLLGIPIYATWISAWSAVVGILTSPWWGGATALAMPVFGVISLWIREQWSGTIGDVRRFATLRSRGRLIEALRDEQERLAEALERHVPSAP